MGNKQKLRRLADIFFVTERGTHKSQGWIENKNGTAIRNIANNEQKNVENKQSIHFMERYGFDKANYDMDTCYSALDILNQHKFLSTMHLPITYWQYRRTRADRRSLKDPEVVFSNDEVISVNSIKRIADIVAYHHWKNKNKQIALNKAENTKQAQIRELVAEYKNFSCENER